MGRDAYTDRETTLACLDTIEAAYDQLQECSLDAFSSEELLAVLARRERLARRAPVVDHRILARLVADGNPGALGAASLSTVLVERLRISTREARRRLGEATDLGPRTTLTGDPLQPVLPELAAAQAAGRIGAEHITIARTAYTKIPATVAASDRARAECSLALLAGEYGPATFQKLAEHLIAVLDPDGDFADRERRTRRGLWMSRQGVDGMSTLTAKITPELRATLEPLLAKLAAPGMCNAADEHPCIQGTPTEAQIHGDHRTPDQRRHDALLAAARIVLATGDLGQLNGLPVTVIVTTTLAELHAAAGLPEPAPGSTGKALTAGDTVLPISDLLRMAGHAIHYLTIFDGQGRALWLGRTKRIATADQRIVLHGRDHGCTRPGCTVSGYLTQAHHLEHDWAHNGRTDVDTLALVCPADNRMATDQDWTTKLNDAGRVEWIPPPELERGQPRVNPYHFIEDLVDHHARRSNTEAPGKPHDRPHRESGNPATPDPYDDAYYPPDLWPDDPSPGDPQYDRALDELYRSYETAP
jgi:hypothetical protein